MPPTALSALVLQGGGALGAYELGAMRRLYRDADFAPAVIAGVSIGAITAALLGRPARGLSPLQALDQFWEAVTVSGWWLPPPLRGYASMTGNPGFFIPRTDLYDMAGWTSLYDTRPLRRTLEGLIDLEALAASGPGPSPRLVLTATDIEAGQIASFDSATTRLSLDHIMASGSLPPAFPMTRIGERAYWDGGLFDNTPLGFVLEALARLPPGPRRIYVVNLFPNRSPLPANLSEVSERMMNIAFCNRTRQDLAMMERIDEIAELLDALGEQPDGLPPQGRRAFERLTARAYVRAPEIVEITRAEAAQAIDAMDFSPAAIQSRADEGYACADRALKRRAGSARQG